MLKHVKKTFQYGHHQVTLEVGEIARQASAAVMVDMAGTVVLVTCVARKEADESKSFFPLIVNYQEKNYAAGRIPGGYFRREGRPSEQETLISRLIDRPLRPLFPANFRNEVQVIATVMSLNPEVSADIPAMIGASAAVTLSGAPFAGPIAGARVAYQDGEFLLNPSNEELKESQLNLVVAGTESAVLMVESAAKELPEETMLDAVIFGHQHMQVVINAINEMKAEAGTVDWAPAAVVENSDLQQALTALVEEDLRQAYQISEKMARYDQIETLRRRATDSLAASDEAEEKPSDGEVSSAFAKLEKQIVRRQVLDGGVRIDGRDTRTVRPISIRTGLLPRTHGSALFTRGETQAIVTVTMGSSRDAQKIDALEGERQEQFMLHYNFLPYCVGETGMVGSPKRREIGHGYLAKRAVQAVLPTEEEFPYVLRIVSEITESNGSSSMATICGSSLALMDAGIPIASPVAGIAMGLIKEEDCFAVLTDILGDEDHLGDMDFKVAGTRKGVTALQMDIKISGINRQIMHSALEQAKEGRLFILDEMERAIDKPREEISEFAPRISTFKIPSNKIRDVIGKGGATIRGICESTGVNIDIEDDGTIKVFAVGAAAVNAAREQIDMLTADVEIGQFYEGRIEKLMDFGAFVELLPGKSGFLHISQICEKRLENIADELSEGQVIRVKVVEIDRQGRVRVSMKPSVLAAVE
ncbi:MAG: polyribonucleotide nucleotidyltransferase [Gammaproteobacteria bacterium]|nr:polyribonucleotide nucleotidyltransferase [Gammaproteobacteria bacterium]MCP4476062.1 polyribonucleotide nucleotidyltransferase [Gammaproteobacteria bacterium]